MYQKILISKGIVEVYEYEKLNVNAEGGYHPPEDLEQQEENYKITQRKRRDMVRRLICSNFDSGSKFLTLTFDDKRNFDIRSVPDCNYAFKCFCQRIKRRFPDFQYVSVIEFQDKNGRGAVHYHMICNLPFVKASVLQSLWGQGYIKINAIDKVDNVGAYVIKYMTTDLDDLRLQGLKAYNRSRGLKTPLEIASWRDSDTEMVRWSESLINEKSPTYAATYESDKAGKIVYRQYNLNRK